MKKFFVILGLFVVAGFLGFSQDGLTPLFQEEYYLHDVYYEGRKVNSIPHLAQGDRPSYFQSCSPDMIIFDSYGKDSLWVKIQSSTSTVLPWNFARDSEGRIWVTITSYQGEVYPYYFIKGKDITSVDSIIGVYWVSWYLMPGTKDVYPQLNYVSAE